MTQRQQQTKSSQFQSLPPISYQRWYRQSREFTKPKEQTWAGGVRRMQRHPNQIPASQHLYLCASHQAFLEDNLALFSSIRQREVHRDTTLSMWQASMSQDVWALWTLCFSISPKTLLLFHEGPEGEDFIWGDNGWSLEHPVNCSQEKGHFRRHPQFSFPLF